MLRPGQYQEGFEQRVDPVQFGVQASGQRDGLRRWRFWLLRATSREARMVASGVRSSCEALATNRRWALNAVSSRSSRPSMVSPNSLSSSCGPQTASRSLRLNSEMRWAVSVISRTGRMARPATSQPKAKDSSVMTASAIREATINSCEIAEWACRDCSAS